jgi:hypothetical protein
MTVRIVEAGAEAYLAWLLAGCVAWGTFVGLMNFAVRRD